MCRWLHHTEMYVLLILFLRSLAAAQISVSVLCLSLVRRDESISVGPTCSLCVSLSIDPYIGIMAGFLHDAPISPSIHPHMGIMIGFLPDAPISPSIHQNMGIMIGFLRDAPIFMPIH